MKNKVLAIFGGQSSEHIVSCMSAVNVISSIDRELYDVIMIGITEEGHWLLVDSVETIKDETWRQGSISAILSPDATEKCMIVFREEGIEKVKIDVIFPILHGMYGEDGTIQGFFEMAKIPYVGCGVLASAVSMDKFFTKIIAGSLGVRQAEYVPVMRGELADMPSVIKRVEYKFNYPVFIKPSSSGSSRGVSKACTTKELEHGLLDAARYDRKILVEEMLKGHEVECAVFGGGNEPVIASAVGEVLAAADFYDFDAKYYNNESRTVVNPKLPGDSAERVRQDAVAIFKAVDGAGLARVDFFVTEEGEVIFNEINTMPGFTAISMYPMLFEAAGVSKIQLITDLLEHGMKRYIDQGW